MAISRVTAVWSGFSGAPGYTNFFFDAFGGGDVVDLEHARVEAFFTGIADTLPGDVSVTVQQEVAILDEASGELTGYQYATGTVTPIEGGGNLNYAGPVGGVIGWNTNAIARGRRLRGRTFIVPMVSSAYDPQGNLTTGTLTTLRAGADALMGDGTGPSLVIWSRPRDGAGGSIGEVTSHRVPDLAAVLRSRRD